MSTVAALIKSAALYVKPEGIEGMMRALREQSAFEGVARSLGLTRQADISMSRAHDIMMEAKAMRRRGGLDFDQYADLLKSRGHYPVYGGGAARARQILDEVKPILSPSTWERLNQRVLDRLSRGIAA